MEEKLYRWLDELRHRIRQILNVFVYVSGVIRV